jgi:hypothetical protein
MFFFVPCIVIQLRNVNQQMHTFEINVLIQFLVSSTCFEHHVFIISSLAGGRMQRIHLPDSIHEFMKNITYKSACTNGFPADEHMMFETCKIRQALN